MTPFLSEIIFVGFIIGMLLLLAGLQSIARFNGNKRNNRSIIIITPPANTGARVIPFTKTIVKPSKERIAVRENLQEEEVV